MSATCCNADLSRDSMRLEVVKLCHRHDLEPERIIERAKAIEAYVLEPEAAPRRPKRSAPAGNSDEVI